jgi:hypothetical protein
MASVKQKKWLINVASGMNQTEATMQAYGIKDKHLASIMGSQIKNSKGVQKMFDKSGISESKLFDKVNEALSALKIQYTHNGQEHINPDYYIRLKASELCFKLLGYLGNNNGETKSDIPPSIKVQFINVRGYKPRKAFIKNLKEVKDITVNP